MISKTITYTDYNGTARRETLWFNLSKAELMVLESKLKGGISGSLQALVNNPNGQLIMDTVRMFILESYGERSVDGKHFLKRNESGEPLKIAFEQSIPYEELFTELVFDPTKAAEFINGIMPKDLASDVAKLAKDYVTNNPDDKDIIPMYDQLQKIADGSDVDA